MQVVSCLLLACDATGGGDVAKTKTYLGFKYNNKYEHQPLPKILMFNKHQPIPLTYDFLQYAGPVNIKQRYWQADTHTHTQAV